jgi:endonuclease/exonuclease/phosphatase (EEP) superfamily protein YafD
MIGAPTLNVRVGDRPHPGVVACDSDIGPRSAGGCEAYHHFRVAVVALLLLAGCAPAVNLVEPAGPRFTGDYALLNRDTLAIGPMRIVTFNVKLARRIDRAIEVLRGDSLRGADILTLEEMDDRGTDSIARALKLNYVYYPGAIHPTEHKYFGPAVLSPWPIRRSWKLLLPHVSRTRRQRRTATVAEVVVRGLTIRVYGVHLETPAGGSERVREDQVGAILDDAESFRGPVVVAGDFNSFGIGLVFQRHGYRWLTKYADPTISYFTWDQIFVRGLRPAAPQWAGVVRDTRGASDHRPVYAVVVPDGRAGGQVYGHWRTPESP